MLQPGGILRVVVPDMENIAKTYLGSLESASKGCKEGEANYEWVMLEMFDQMVRNVTGGEMLEYLYRKDIPNEAFVVGRCGSIAKKIMANAQQYHEAGLTPPLPGYPPPSTQRELSIEQGLGAEYEALQIGRFRTHGEVHQGRMTGIH